MSARIALVALLVLLLAGCGRVVLYSEVSEQQANEMIGALIADGIDAEKRRADEQWSVLVRREQIPQAMQSLASRGLPREDFKSLGDVFEKDGFASSPLEEKARYLFGLSQELSATLQGIDGVISARVHIALPERDLLSESAPPSSASVVIVEAPGSNVRDRETDIKAIVKDSIEGLEDINKVTVKFFTGTPALPAPVAGATKSEPRIAGLSPVLALTIAAGVLCLLLGLALAPAREALRRLRAQRDARPLAGRQE